MPSETSGVAGRRRLPGGRRLWIALFLLVSALGLAGAFALRAWRHRPPPTPVALPARAMPEVLRGFEGRMAADAFGSYIASGADLDGDGVPESILPAPDDDTDGPNRGSVVVRSGRSGDVLWRVAGDAPEAFLGERVAVGPDVDGDGVPEVLIRARGVGGATDRVMVHGGRDGHTIRQLTANRRFDEIGTSLLALPDLDGDGVGEIAAGASGRWDQLVPGRVHVFSGATGGMLRTFMGPDRNQDRFGFTMVLAGDQDGDGVPELAIGCLDGAEAGAYAGAVYVFSLADGHKVSTIEGSTRRHQLGHELAQVADIDGNGRPELLVGSFFSEGRGFVRLVDPRTGTVHRELVSDVPGDAFGHSVAVIGDVDGDGTADWAIGAPDAPHPPTGLRAVGCVHVVSGATGATIAVVWGDLERAHFGYAVAPAGDVDGDGHADMLVGAVVEGELRGYARIVSPAKAAAAGMVK